MRGSTMPVTVMDYQTGRYLRTATRDDIQHSSDCDPGTGTFADDTGRSIYLADVRFDGTAYDWD